MIAQEILSKLIQPNASKLVLVVFDGLGGLPDEKTGRTELESARHPNLDKFAEEGCSGLSTPISPGITPGSGPSHLALFGYDPFRYEIGRGLLDTLGIEFPLRPGDVAARGNLATIDENGLLTDRRAGRIATEKTSQLCKLLDEIVIDGIKFFVRPVKEHRVSVVMRGAGLSDKINDTDPQKTGVKPLKALGQTGDGRSEFTAGVVNKFLEVVGEKLAPHKPANYLLLRGFAEMITIPSFSEIYKVKAAAIAIYPMYRGLARLLGMDVLPLPEDVAAEFRILRENFSQYDFFFLHIKGTDSAGEDGDFARKVRVIEEADRYFSIFRELCPDVLVVTGDHSTPAKLKGHSWHPVPVLISTEFSRTDLAKEFGERACLQGALGRIPMKELMSLAMAYALKLDKFGA